MRKASAKPGHPASDCDACAAQVAAILAERALRVSFRPIADFETCGMLGYIAAVRGPAGTLFGSFDQLARVAAKAELLDEFTRECFAVMLQRFLEHGAAGIVFVPLPPGLIEARGAELAAELQALATALNGESRRIALLLPGIDHAQLEAAAQFVAALRRAGFLCAARNFGCAMAERRVWTHAGPDFILIDPQQIEGIDLATVENTRFAVHLEQAAAKGSRIVADGIRSINEFSALQQFGIRYGAGDFIGRANATPARALPAAAHKVIAAACTCDGGAPTAPGGVLSRLLTRAVPVTPATHAEDVFMQFEHNADLRAIAVVEDGIPRGLISRYEMVDNMARPFRHELYGRKPCTRFMDAQPLVVDIGVSLAELSEIVVGADPRHLISGFIITERGKYLGMGSVQDLVREVTAMQMEAAMYANPLTQLPGNVPINQHIDNQLAAGEPFCIAYCDLDHFKPFNDVYGYAKGDEVIQLTARALSGVCDAERDFLGHIGGDDFVMVLRSADWEARCNAALERFGAEILGFFSHDDIERGGYVTENRKGEMEFHRLTSLSIGAVEALPGTFQNHLQVSKIAAEVKKRAKAIPGNSLFVNRRTYADAAAKAEEPA